MKEGMVGPLIQSSLHPQRLTNEEIHCQSLWLLGGRKMKKTFPVIILLVPVLLTCCGRTQTSIGVAPSAYELSENENDIIKKIGAGSESKEERQRIIYEYRECENYLHSQYPEWTIEIISARFGNPEEDDVFTFMLHNGTKSLKVKVFIYGQVDEGYSVTVETY